MPSPFLAGLPYGIMDAGNFLAQQQDAATRNQLAMMQLQAIRDQLASQDLSGNALLPLLAGQPRAQSPVGAGDILPPSSPMTPQAGVGGLPQGGGGGGDMVSYQRPPFSVMAPIIAQAESGGRNIPTGLPNSTASGYFQDVDPTWRQWAQTVPGAAAYPRAMDAPLPIQYAVNRNLYNAQGTKPWVAPGIPKVGPATGQQAQLAPTFTSPGTAPQQPAQSTDGASPDPMALGQVAAQTFPMETWGRNTLIDAARRIEEIAPDAPGHIKIDALQQIEGILAPEEKAELRAALSMMQRQTETPYQRQEMDLRERELRERERRDRAMEDERGTWQAQVDPANNNQLFYFNNKTRQTVDAQGNPYTPGGAQRIGTASGTAFTDSEARYWARVVKAGGSLPPGLGRSGQIVQRVAKEIADEGGDPGMLIERHASVQSDAAALKKLQGMSDQSAAFEKTALYNLDRASRLLKGAAPTNLGPWLNKWIETGETQAGNTAVPPATVAVLTFANEYAKVMSGAMGAQGATVDSRREAAELFNPYFSAGQWDAVAEVAKQEMGSRMQSYDEQLGIIRERLRGGSSTPGASPRQQPVEYKTPEDVAKALDAGKITEDQARQLMFKYFRDTIDTQSGAPDDQRSHPPGTVPGADQ